MDSRISGAQAFPNQPTSQHTKTRGSGRRQFLRVFSEPVRSTAKELHARPLSQMPTKITAVAKRLLQPQAIVSLAKRAKKAIGRMAEPVILATHPADSRPLSTHPEPNHDPLGWGGKRDVFSGTSEIQLGSKQKATEKLIGVETKELATNMLEKNRARADSLELYKPCSLFLERDQTWVHTNALRQTAAVKDVNEFAVIEPTNMQEHSIVEGENNLCFEQFGGLSDHRNTHVSLSMLERLSQDDIVALLRKRETAARTAKEKTVIKIAIDEMKFPARATARRRFLLEQQMLIVVHNRLKNAVASKTIKDGTLHLSHVGLLNPNKKATNADSGVLHDESVILDDMSTIFSEFNGRIIHFDDTPAPYLEGDIIHMPEMKGLKEPLTLRTHFGNVSIQGRRTFAGDRQQKKSNKNLIVEMQAELNKNPSLVVAKEMFGRCCRDLREGKQSFHLAADLLEVQIALGWQVSTGCFSNKDRGGVVGALLCSTHLAYTRSVRARASEGALEMQAESIRRKGLTRALESGSLALQAAELNNSGQTALKVNIYHDISTPRQMAASVFNLVKMAKDRIFKGISHAF